jgi:hypothetical protein
MALQRSVKQRHISDEMDGAMNSDVTGLIETGEDILICGVSDATLERAAGVEDQKITTYVYCTYAWYICGSDQ